MKTDATNCLDRKRYYAVTDHREVLVVGNGWKFFEDCPLSINGHRVTPRRGRNLMRSPFNYTITTVTHYRPNSN